jgi:predicted exporter
VLGGLACGGSLSQSAVNEGAGARTEMSPIIAAALSLVTVIALLLLVYRASRPRISMLGADPTLPGYSPTSGVTAESCRYPAY